MRAPVGGRGSFFCRGISPQRLAAISASSLSQPFSGFSSAPRAGRALACAFSFRIARREAAALGGRAGGPRPHPPPPSSQRGRATGAAPAASRSAGRTRPCACPRSRRGKIGMPAGDASPGGPAIRPRSAVRRGPAGAGRGRAPGPAAAGPPRSPGPAAAGPPRSPGAGRAARSAVGSRARPRPGLPDI